MCHFSSFPLFRADQVLNWGWILIGDGGVITPVHCDSTGQATLIREETGVKFWCILDIHPDQATSLDSYQASVEFLCDVSNWAGGSREHSREAMNAMNQAITKHANVSYVALMPGDVM